MKNRSLEWIIKEWETGWIFDSCGGYYSVFVLKFPPFFSCVSPVSNHLVLSRGLNALLSVLVFGLGTVCWIMDLLPYNWSFSHPLHPKMVNKSALAFILFWLIKNTSLKLFSNCPLLASWYFVFCVLLLFVFFAVINQPRPGAFLCSAI